jgi:LEA14-like dessication related protein
MKPLLYVGILFVIVLIIIYARIKIVFSNIGFDYKFNGADKSGLNFTNLAQTGNANIDLDIDLILENKTTFSTKISNVTVEIYYNGTVCASTIEPIEVILNSKSKSTIPAKIRLNLNAQSLTFMSSFILSDATNVEYKIKGTFYKIPISTTGVYNYKSEPSQTSVASTVFNFLQN